MKEEQYKILKRYLKGLSTAEERHYVKQLLVDEANNNEFWEVLFNEWKNTSSTDQLNINKEKSWNEFREKILKPEKTKSSSPNRRHIGRGWVAAASVLLALLVGVSYFLMFDKGEVYDNLTENTEYTIKKTDKGEKLNISLPDGSFIKLNSSTELRIPPDYNSGNERVVYLEGEAFFDVARYGDLPFKVVTGDVTTQVLGTSFNVNTHHDREQVSVSVVTGKVSVSNKISRVLLNPLEMTLASAESGDLKKGEFDMETVTGWRNNILIFEKVSFDEIIEILNEWYGVEFVINGQPSIRKKYSGRFENKSLPLVLDGLGFSSAFDYRIENKTVYLNFKN